MTEQWKKVGGWPYDVSDSGRVRSHKGERVLALHKMPNGYLQVSLYSGGSRRNTYAHILVAEAFHGPKPSPSHEVAHGDGNRQNNQADNIRWATRSENHLDKNLHGTMLAGERHHMAKLTEAQVFEIRRRVAGGELQKDMATEFGVSKMAVSRAVRGENWRGSHA